MTLRPYQQSASDAIMSEIRTSVEPCLAELATGAGKSHIIADIAERVWTASGKRVLCLAPSKELVLQNRSKFLASGNPASLFSASAGQKSLRHHVVFGTPLTVKNSIGRFTDQFAMVVIDEAHGITPTIIAIIDRMRSHNPNLRVVGFTATPYRLGTGYIYRYTPDGSPVREDQAKDPYFHKMVYTIGARDLIDMGFLTPPVIGQIGAGHYDTSGLHLNKMGKFDAADVDQAYHGQGRKTSKIIADVVNHAQGREGVIIFAATVRHAKECMESLPPEISEIITADTKDRGSILDRFQKKRLKYLVNVGVLTTGFDAEHIDIVALMRRTESVGLLQQMIGRGLRLHDGKDDCLVLDYAENIENHCPDGDIFAPEIKTSFASGESFTVHATCPDCGIVNEFKGRPNPSQFEHDENGYFVDLEGIRIETEHGPMPAHFGRRCWGMLPRGDRCDHRWTFKECQECNEPNDIAARYCTSCREEIVDPNEKLRIEFKRLKRDPTRTQTDEVVDMTVTDGLSSSGNPTLRIEWTTPHRSFTTWIQKNPKSEFAWRAKRMFDNAEKPIRSVTYQKNAKTKFYDIHAYNKEPDHDPTN